jgi:hypothetical protein
MDAGGQRIEGPFRTLGQLRSLGRFRPRGREHGPDGLGVRGGGLGELADFFRHHREASAAIARMGRLDRSVHGEDVGASGDVVDHGGYPPDLVHMPGDLLEGLVGGYECPAAFGRPGLEGLRLDPTLAQFTVDHSRGFAHRGDGSERRDERGRPGGEEEAAPPPEGVRRQKRKGAKGS